ncbi:MAG TPA: hypothetical protein VJG32_23575 [Anaerolineae bacterium]|nr:hypothetical protein [Anaerolineae bacterium]
MPFSSRAHDDRRERLTETVDKIRVKYGDDALKRASLARKRERGGAPK